MDWKVSSLQPCPSWSYFRILVVDHASVRRWISLLVMTAPLMVRVDFEVAGMVAVGAECHLAGEFGGKSSAWPSHPSFSYTSNGANML